MAGVIVLIVIAIAIAIAFIVTSFVLTAKYDTDMKEQAGILSDLQDEYDILSNEHEKTIVEFDELSTEYRIELGKAERIRIRDIWTMYYNTCLLITNGNVDNCLKSARSGYIDAIHNMIPSRGWDWQYIQFGETQEEG